MKNVILVLFLFGFLIPISGIELPHIFTNNMILQRNTMVPVWGKAHPLETITIEFLNQHIETKADTAGNWKIWLQAMPAVMEPATLKILGSDTVTFTNVLVGEVWLCSGQSNMEYPVNRSLKKYAGPKKGTDLGDAELTNCRNNNIRLFLVERKLDVPDLVTKKGWQECNDTSIQPVSAAGYFFIKEIYKALQVPVGIISTSWGGSRIEPWTAVEAYKSSNLFVPDSASTYQIDGSKVGNMWNSMIRPLVPYAIKGFLWYQGESNCMINDGLRYADKFEIMLNAWRQAWSNPNLPFYFVQISPFYYTQRHDKKQHTSETLPETWEAQTKTLQLPKTGMVVTTDLVDNLSDIHPSYKWEVGRRLSLLALANDYGKKVTETSGPELKSFRIKGNKVILSFNHCAKGLGSNDSNQLSWFTIAGSDGKFVNATAEIKGKTIIVQNTDIAKPAIVRFAWHETAMPNLVNSEGLPAIPFRTDSPEWKPKIK